VQIFSFHQSYFNKNALRGKTQETEKIEKKATVQQRILSKEMKYETIRSYVSEYFRFENKMTQGISYISNTLSNLLAFFSLFQYAILFFLILAATCTHQKSKTIKIRIGVIIHLLLPNQTTSSE
jgi:hypothetical protein